jgi:hypothetical protein
MVSKSVDSLVVAVTASSSVTIMIMMAAVLAIDLDPQLEVGFPQP